MRFEIYSSPEHSQYGNSITYTGRYLWYWRLRARNGRIIADGAEAYATRAGVRKAIRRLTNPANFINIPVVEVDS